MKGRTAMTKHAFLPTGTPPELIEAIEDEIRDVFVRHGAAAFEATREAAVTHETAHAIVGAHEGLTVRRITIFSQSGMWGGRCMLAGGAWTSNADTSADEDLSRARFIIAGLAGEAMAGYDKPGSSIDELGVSQTVGSNAALKLADPKLSDAAYRVYAQRLWHEEVWGAAVEILRANYEPFWQLAEDLNQHERLHGNKLSKVLAQVRRIPR
jgi:hypothetical protein